MLSHNVDGGYGARTSPESNARHFRASVQGNEPCYGRVVLLSSWEVVRTLELDPISFASGDSLLFRIEIQRRLTAPLEYRAKVFRIEMFQMRPSFPDASRESTESVYLSDDSYTGDVRGPDPDDVLARVLADIERQFGAAH